MDDEIIQHKKFVAAEIQRLKKSRDFAAATRLLSYHDSMTRNFQHERQIHLIITLFFAALMLLAWFGFAATYVQVGNFDVALWPLLSLVLILTVLETFYIRYYYHLENRTQKLYKLTDEIYQLMR